MARRHDDSLSESASTLHSRPEPRTHRTTRVHARLDLFAGHPDVTALSDRMDATPFIALATLCASIVHPTTAQAIVATESTFNPNAIGVHGRGAEIAIVTSPASGVSAHSGLFGCSLLSARSRGTQSVPVDQPCPWFSD